jgi:hypothetical protein
MIDLEEIDLYATAPDATTSVRRIRAGKKYAAKILANARSIPNWKRTLAVHGKRWPARRITLAGGAAAVSAQPGWRIEDVITVCRQHGALCSRPRGGGSHYKISKSGKVAILTVPFKRPIKPVYIRKSVSYLREESANG